MTEPAQPPAPAPEPLDTVTWWELPVTDLEEAQRFYGAVFGWTFTPFGDGYVAAYAGDAMVGGLTSSSGPPGEGVRVYVNVADLDGTLVKVTEAGGTVRNQRTEVGGDMGWWGDFTDTGGLLVGVCSSRPAA